MYRITAKVNYILKYIRTYLIVTDMDVILRYVLEAVAR